MDLDEMEARADARMAAEEAAAAGASGGEEEDEDEGPGTSVVLHEDKKYYPGAEEVYGRDTETLVMEEDAQTLEVPIIAPARRRRLEAPEMAAPPPSTFTPEFLATLMANAELVRHVAVAGHLHHGKTTVLDMLVEQTHAVRPGPGGGFLSSTFPGLLRPFKPLFSPGLF
jgi:U5 small nuclear ribonucleoprotein component